MRLEKRIIGIENEYGITDKIGICCNFVLARHFLENGGYVYKDGEHPEYCTPETTNAFDAVLYDKAGELIVSQAFPDFVIFKNNSDGHRHSYGTHENYLVRSVHSLSSELIDFLVTRQIITGAGDIDMNGRFEISQRARFIQAIQSSKSTHDK